MSNSKEAKARAEAAFKRKEQQAHEGAKAWAEYQAQRRAVAEKTERLRALRLAKKAVETKRTRQMHDWFGGIPKKDDCAQGFAGWNPAWGSELRPQR